MAPIKEIFSFSHPLIKYAVKLRKKNVRDSEKEYLIEGYREVKRAIASNVRIQKFFYAKDLFLGENEQDLIDLLHQKGVEILSCPKELFQKISYRDRPDGLLAIATMDFYSLQSLENKIKKEPFFLVAEKIEKPGNLGSILRSSDAAGVDGVIVCDPVTDIFNPNVIRASIGTLFTQIVVQATSVDTLQFLQDRHVLTIAATPHAKKEYTEVDLTGPVAIIVGSEQYGLSDQWMERCDQKVRIPMRGIADSLNVAVASTLLLYEVLRQRK